VVEYLFFIFRSNSKRFLLIMTMLLFTHHAPQELWIQQRDNETLSCKGLTLVELSVDFSPHVVLIRRNWYKIREKAFSCNTLQFRLSLRCVHTDKTMSDESLDRESSRKCVD
jgi:hypothetical protein